MENSLIQKKIIHVGTEAATFQPGSKVRFHFVTKTCGEDSVTIDDSRTIKRPMELVLGKKFKLEVWETIVQTMAVNEVASFTVDKSLVLSYPFISKTLRDLKKPKGEKKSHCCGTMFHVEGVGYDDLNRLLKEPQDLEFIIELLNVESSEDYLKEIWQMDDVEKHDVVPQLKEEGNELYRTKDYKQAAEKYARAIGMLEQLMLKEKPGDTEWTDLNNMKLPILLNYAQCKLIEEEYYTVIEHCTTILKSDVKNVKALYRRGKAHVGAWNPEEARKDFLQALKLDPTLKNLIQKEIKELDLKIKEKDLQDRKILEGKMF